MLGYKQIVDFNTYYLVKMPVSITENQLAEIFKEVDDCIAWQI